MVLQCDPSEYQLVCHMVRWLVSSSPYRLVGVVVMHPPRERKIRGSSFALRRDFSGSSHTSDLKIGTPVATLPDA